MGINKKKVRPHYVAKANRKKEPMSKNTKIGLFAGCGLLLLGIILFIVLYNDGSLPVRDGVIASKQDNWIISKLQTASSGKYFKLGEVLAPVEGYAQDLTASIKSDTNETSFSYNPIDPDSQVDGYNILGVASSAEEMVESLPSQYALYFPDSQFSEPKTAEVAGVQARYLIATTPELPAEETPQEETPNSETEDAASENTATPEENANETTNDRTATQQMLCYIPSIRNSCVLISINLRITDDMPEWTEEALLELTQNIGKQIVIEQ